MREPCGRYRADYQRTLTIQRNGNQLLVTGVGDPGEQWIGSVDGTTVKFAGDRAEGVGVTTASLTFVVDTTTDPWTTAGSETWTHTNCSGGSSGATAVKVN